MQFVQHLAHPPVELQRHGLTSNRQSRVVFITRNISEQQVRALIAGASRAWSRDRYSLIAAGNFRLPGRNLALDEPDQPVQSDRHHHQNDDRNEHGGGVKIVRPN